MKLITHDGQCTAYALKCGYRQRYSNRVLKALPSTRVYVVQYVDSPFCEVYKGTNLREARKALRNGF